MAQSRETPTKGTCTGGAGQATQAMHGVVTDPSGAVIPNASVFITCGNFRRVGQTDAAGRYSITLPPGSYLLRTVAAGFANRQDQIQVPSAQGLEQNVTLQLVSTASTVTVIANPDYVADNSTTATKTNTPLIDTPQSVTVVTNMQMQARDVQTVDYAIAYTAGIDPEPYGVDPRIDWFFIRGFAQTEDSLYLDNLGTTKIYQPDAQFTVPPYALQSIDVLKGPSSVLYGANEPGGLVNLVAKQPPTEGYHQLQMEFGNYDRYQGSLDFGGPVDGSSKWFYRLTGQVRSSGSQVNYAQDDAAFAQPQISWKPDDKTSLTVRGDFYEGRQGAIGGFLPAQGTLYPNPNGPIPTSFYDADPNFDKYQKVEYFGTYNFQRKLGKNWVFRQNFRSSHLEVFYHTLYGIGIDPDMQTLERASYAASVNAAHNAVDNQLQGNFRTGALQHTVLLGFGYQHQNALDQVGYLGYDFPGEVPAINIYHPVYGLSIATPPYNGINTTGTLQQYGVYAQDQMSIGRFNIALAGREDWAPSTLNDALAQAVDKANPSKFTEKVGALYHSSIGLAPYFNFATSFNPVPGVNFYGSPFRPDTGTQYEAGLKFQPRGWNSYITADAFHITQNNVLTSDPNNPFNSIQTGQVESRGLELEGVASLVSNLNFVGSLTHMKVFNSRSNAGIVGKRPVDTPNNMASAWIDYTPAKWGAGVGFRFVGNTPGAPDNSFFVPSHTVMDAEVHLIHNHFRYAFSASNLLNNTYVAYCYSTYDCNYGGKITVTGIVTYDFKSLLHPF